MKRNLILILLFAMVACEKENTSNLNLDEKVDKTTSVEKAKGSFSNGGPWNGIWRCEDLYYKL